MKKTILATALLSLFAAVFISCGSTKEIQSAPDTYTSDEEIAAPVIEESGNAETVTPKTATTKKKKNAIEDFFTFGNKDEYIFYDQTTVYTKEITGMTEKNASVVVRYDNHMAGFGSYNSLMYYYVLFDKDNRATLSRAIESYFSDFDNKRLQRKGKKTDRAYGKIGYRLSWGSISSSTPNYGYGEGYCGYEFVKGSPYFVIYNYEFDNIYYERAGDATTRKSNFVKYYFTKSQLRNLRNLLSEEKITEQILTNDSEYIFSPSGADEY